MNRTFVTTALSLFALQIVCASDQKPDMKFINEAAGIVWNSTSEHFNPKAELTDSVFEGNSATFIAVDNVIEAHRNEATPFGPYKGLNRQYLGETTIDYYNHLMVRLNDSKAIEEFADQVFGAKEEIKIGSGFIVYSKKHAFGARIHKPDGRIINVDVSTALPETEGKKNKVKSFRLSIPELEQGDVLEYFRFIRQYFLGDQKTGLDLRIFMQYPTAYYNFTGRFDKILTTEINTFNGLDASALTIGRGEDCDTVNAQFINIERFDNPKYSNKYRQVPYMRIKVADNVSNVIGHSPSSRKPGLYFNLTPPVIMAEIADRYATREIPTTDTGKAWGLVKNYKKLHPEASWEEIADACWLASRYIAMESKKSYDNWDVVSLFKDVVDKANLKQPVRLAATASRNAVRVMEIAGYDQATPLVIIGDRTYLHDQNLVYRPGELPGIYQGEIALTLDGPREKVFELLKIRADTLTDSRFRDNSEHLTINASIDPDNDTRINFAYTSMATGTRKSSGSAFLNSSDIIELTEEYLGVKEKKRSKRQFDLMAIDDNRRKALEAMPEIDFDLQDITVDSVAILNPGFLPENKSFEYRITGSAEGLITRAGNDILVNIGNLVGASNYTKVDRDKPRDIDIYTSGPYNLRYTLSFKVPDGYTVDPASLEQLQKNSANLCGSYFAQSAYDEQNNTVNIITNFRNNRRIYPHTMWNEFLDIRDAAIEFADATLALTAR